MTIKRVSLYHNADLIQEMTHNIRIDIIYEIVTFRINSNTEGVCGMRYACVIFVGVFISALAFAGRPLTIDDADPVEPGQFEFEAGEKQE